MITEIVKSTEDYKGDSLWQKAFLIDRTVGNLTRDFPTHNAYVRILREKVEALPPAIALTLRPARPIETADAQRSAYELAHDAEYVLLFCIMFKYLPLEDAKELQSELCDLKRLIMMAVDETVNRCTCRGTL